MPTAIVKLNQQARLGVKQTHEMLDGSLGEDDWLKSEVQDDSEGT